MSHSNPYMRPVKRTWWLKRPAYRFYMLREATILPLITFTLFLTYGLIAFLLGSNTWQGWLTFMTHPIVITMNMIALFASLLHAHTFFSMMPQVMPIRLRGKLVTKSIVVLAQWSMVALVSLIVLLVI
ncbi:fumarate reductase subunit FrdC [Vibrio ostreicida]|uniref:fumarate reductase subunit FrdC n=1 Tax=Vibrio ostreicida TaxID=526588 RepID=UPI003B5A4C34